ncbi:MAG: hypothetical protein HA490_00645 [Archaeoglobales archaeon]|nr:hypothetical protein [Archaeoglobales archaeon]
MENIDELMEEVLRKIRFRDTVAAVAISTAFVAFGILILILLDVIFVSLAFKTAVSIFLLVLAWVLMVSGIYLLTSIPIPPLPPRIVADSQGIAKLLEKGYSGRIFVTRETYRRIPPKFGLRANLQIIEVDKEEAEKYAKFGEELSYAIAGAKKIRAKVVSTKKMKAAGVEILTADEIVEIPSKSL